MHQAVHKGVVEPGAVEDPSATMIRAEPLPGTVMGGFRRREVLEGTLIWVGNLVIMMGILTVKILKFQGVLDKDGPHSLI